MAQQQFTLFQGISEELELFPQIAEFGMRKNASIDFGSFEPQRSEYLQIWFVVSGKFEWSINKHQHVLIPGNTALVLPGQEIGGTKGFFEIGSLIWIKLKVDPISSKDRILLESCSHLSKFDSIEIGRILKCSEYNVFFAKETGSILKEIYFEILNREIGFATRINLLIDSLLIMIGRKFTEASSCDMNFSQTFKNLEKSLKNNLSHQWTVEEMASMVELGTTAFNEKVKSYSGFTPLNYLINIRISEAIKLLGRKETKITDIAMNTGFYSSQHFSTTFKRLTGHTPGEYRKSQLLKV